MTLQRRSRHVRAPQTRAGRCRTRRRLRSSSTRPPRAIASRAQKSLPSERAMTPRASDIRHSRAPRKQLVRRVSLNARQLSHRWARPKPATLAPLCARCTLAPTLAGSHARLTFSCGAAPSPPGPPALLPLAIAAPRLHACELPPPPRSHGSTRDTPRAAKRAVHRLSHQPEPGCSQRRPNASREPRRASVRKACRGTAGQPSRRCQRRRLCSTTETRNDASVARTSPELFAQRKASVRGDLWWTTVELTS